jgi:hypothetical protein
MAYLKKIVSSHLDSLIIIVLASFPLFLSFPYRVNIFLSWEGAYRLSEGQIPFRDFGLPLGGMYWVIPGIFMKLFGTQLVSLIKAQVFINIVAGLSFRSILKSCKVANDIRIVSVLVFCLSYSLMNFWPWYNHSVIVYQLVAMAFLCRYLFASNLPKQSPFLHPFFTALFLFFALLTKQDAGAMGFLVAAILLLVHSILEKKWIGLLLFLGSYASFVLVFFVILPLGDVTYWFNFGQTPHSSRIAGFDFVEALLAESVWIKFYALIIIFLQFARFNSFRAFMADGQHLLFFLMTMGILVEAALFQVTSYTPPNNNIFFHSFCIAYMLHSIAALNTSYEWRSRFTFWGLMLVALWWSPSYWGYLQRVTERVFGRSIHHVEDKKQSNTENVVNKHTYVLSNAQPKSEVEKDWKFSQLPVFKNIYMPSATVDGINRLQTHIKVHKVSPQKVLNMSELTPLAAAIPFQLEKGPQIPLWHHLGVGMFNRQAAFFENRISRNYYDLVLFEYIPNLNNFYPFRVRDSLMAHYQKIDSFSAPRRGDDMQGSIEIYVPRQQSNQ